jgi:hypothetical protein
MQFGIKFKLRITQISFCVILLSFFFACEKAAVSEKRKDTKFSLEFTISSLAKTDRNLSVVIAEKNIIIGKYEEKNCKLCKKIIETYKPGAYFGTFYPIKGEKITQIYKKRKNLITFNLKLNPNFRYLFIVATKSLKSKGEIEGLCMWNLDFPKFTIIPKRLELTCKEETKPPSLSPITINY